MFGFSKKEKQSGLPKQLQEFLTSADDVYMRAFSMKSVKVLGKHFSRECCVKLSRIIYGEVNARFFGTDKFRLTNWTTLETKADCVVLLKDVAFDKIKISKSFKMAIADDYREKWTVSIPDYSVIDIARVE